MNKTQFIASLAPHFNGSKKEAAHAVEIIFDSITRNMQKGEDVTINDFYSVSCFLLAAVEMRSQRRNELGFIH